MDAQSVLIDQLTGTKFYAPDFRIEVEGQQLEPAVKADVLEVKVAMDMENLTSFELLLKNWDEKALAFKHSDAKTFDPGHRVHVQLGYPGRMRTMIRGIVTSLAPSFVQGAPLTIRVSGLDSMVLLRDRKPVQGESKKFVKMADWEIAQQIATRNKLQMKLTREGEKHELVVQKNQDDAQFLMERAKRIDFECFVDADPESGDSALKFGKPTDARDSGAARVHVFEWGNSLIRFTPNLTASRQVSQVTVRSWNPREKKVIVGTARPSDLPSASGSGKSGPQIAQESLQGKQEIVVDAPVASEQEARDLAISLLRDRAYGFLTGSGQVIGLPELRPGDNVELKGLGKRFSGKYYVTKAEHALGGAGYYTTFDVRRVSDGGTK